MNDLPTISIVVNTTDRAGPLSVLLSSLERQSYDHFEVVVVVGPTKDDTLDVLAPYQGRVRVLRCPEANLSKSRNLGLLAACGDVVAFIDDDAVPCRTWLAQLAKLFSAMPELAATGGSVYSVHPKHPILQHRIGIVSSLGEQVDVRSSPLGELVPEGEGGYWMARMMGANMAFRRASLLQVGGFDEFYIFIAEETDLAMRLAVSGQMVRPVTEAVVYHSPASSRNREVFSYKGKWWLQTRSGVYFAIKNGRAVGDSWSVVLRRCLELAHGHWLWYGRLARERKVSLVEAWDMQIHEVSAFVEGMVGGVLKKRRLVEESASSTTDSDSILSFSQGAAKESVAVDPVEGHRSILIPQNEALRLCLLSGNYPPEQYDGVGRLTNLMAQGLFELGHNVHIVARGERESIAFYDGAYVHRIRHQTLRYHRYANYPNVFHALNYSHVVHDAIKRLILNDDIQIVDTPIWQYEGLVTCVSGLLPVMVRIVTTSRQISQLQRSVSPDARLMGELEHQLLCRAMHLLPNTRATLDNTINLYGDAISSRPSTIVPYGLVPLPEESLKVHPIENRSEPRKVLFVGRLEERKGIHDLFRAIPHVLRQVPDVHFIIAGEDNSQHDGFLRRTGVDYPTYFGTHYAKLLPQVSFLGKVSDAKLQDLYRQCDLFVAPSLYESFGLIYLEAMNHARPVIGCHVGGVPEVVDDGVTGLLIDPGAPKSLAEAIVNVLQSPRKLREMGLAGRQRLLDKFTYVEMARAFEGVYRSALASHQHRRSLD